MYSINFNLSNNRIKSKTAEGNKISLYGRFFLNLNLLLPEFIIIFISYKRCYFPNVHINQKLRLKNNIYTFIHKLFTGIEKSFI